METINILTIKLNQVDQVWKDIGDAAIINVFDVDSFDVNFSRKVLKEQRINVIILDIDGHDLKELKPFIKELKSYNIRLLGIGSSTKIEEIDKLGVNEYLIKPINSTNILKAINHTIIEKTNPLKAALLPRSKQKIWVKIEGSKYQAVHIDSIMFFEASDHYIKININNQRPLMAKGNLRSVFEGLGDQFFILNRSLIVNRNYVEKVEHGHAVLTNGTKLSIPRSKRKVITDLLGFGESDSSTLILYLSPEEYTPEEIADNIDFLSDLYREIGGDKLEIKSSAEFHLIREEEPMPV